MSVAQTSPRSRPLITLLDESMGRKVLVVSRSEDRFFMTAQEAVEACRAANDSARFSQQFNDLLDQLSKWIEANQAKIHRAQVAVRENDLLFLVTQASPAYDDDLMDSLSALDIDVANSDRFSLIRLNVLAIPRTPDEASTAFIAAPGNGSFVYAR